MSGAVPVDVTLLRGRSRAECRATAARLLADYAGADSKIVREENGKPRFVESDLEFSVGYTEGFAALAVARGSRVGVDVERVRYLPGLDAVAGEFLPADAQEELSTLTGERYVVAFLSAWTRVEAAVKATGEGLGAIPSSLERVVTESREWECGVVASVAAVCTGPLAVRWSDLDTPAVQR